MKWSSVFPPRAEAAGLPKRVYHVFAWANLILAAIDGGLAVREGVSLLKGARMAELISNMKGVEVVSQLNSQQIIKFDKVLRLQDAGNFDDAHKILNQLSEELDPDVFNRANSFFKQAFDADGIIPFGENMLSSAAKIGDEASESSIKIGIVRMEEHPNYENIIKEFKNAGFEIIIHNDFKNSPRVEILEITNKNTGEVKIEKRLHITENMRFTDLEHEYGHLKQIERLGENAPPTNKEEIVTRKDGKTSQIKAKKQQGVLTAK